jgi:hypothetical protein
LRMAAGAAAAPRWNDEEPSHGAPINVTVVIASVGGDFGL